MLTRLVLSLGLVVAILYAHTDVLRIAISAPNILTQLISANSQK